MHQHIRAPPRSTSTTSNPANPERTSTDRNQPLQRARSSVDLASYTERAAAIEASRAAAGSSLQQEKDHTKLNQIIQVRSDRFVETEGDHGINADGLELQNFHTKAALAVCSARANLPPAYNKDGDLRQNKWVSLFATSLNFCKLVVIPGLLRRFLGNDIGSRIRDRPSNLDDFTLGSRCTRISSGLDRMLRWPWNLSGCGTRSGRGTMKPGRLALVDVKRRAASSAGYPAQKGLSRRSSQSLQDWKKSRQSAKRTLDFQQVQQVQQVHCSGTHLDVFGQRAHVQLIFGEPLKPRVSYIGSRNLDTVARLPGYRTCLCFPMDVDLCQDHYLIHSCRTKGNVPGSSCFHTSLLHFFFIVLNDCHMLLSSLLSLLVICTLTDSIASSISCSTRPMCCRMISRSGGGQTSVTSRHRL
jgi:hypothetical protein